MTEIKSHEFERFAERPAERFRIFVLYGPDRGLVSERATLIATSDAEEAHEVADRVLVMDHHTLREETKHSAFTGYQEDTV